MTFRILTHDGYMHADEVLGCALARRYYLQLGQKTEVIRSRRPEDIAAADMVIDVGGVHDPETLRFDHHFPDPPVSPGGWHFSSFGLLWQAIGRDYLRKVGPAFRRMADSDEVEEAFFEMQNRLVKEVDQADNGELSPPAGHISSVVDSLNGCENAWQQAGNVADAVLMAETFRIWSGLQAKREIRDALEAAPGEDVIHLKRRLPWRDRTPENVMFAIYRESGKDGLFMIETRFDSACPDAPHLLFPRETLGLRGQELSRQTGVDDLEFVHHKGLVAGARTLEGAHGLVRLMLPGYAPAEPEKRPAAPLVP